MLIIISDQRNGIYKVASNVRCGIGDAIRERNWGFMVGIWWAWGRIELDFDRDNKEIGFGPYILVTLINFQIT